MEKSCIHIKDILQSNDWNLPPDNNGYFLDFFKRQEKYYRSQRAENTLIQSLNATSFYFSLAKQKIESINESIHFVPRLSLNTIKDEQFPINPPPCHYPIIDISHLNSGNDIKDYFITQYYFEDAQQVNEMNYTIKDGEGEIYHPLVSSFEDFIKTFNNFDKRIICLTLSKDQQKNNFKFLFSFKISTSFQPIKPEKVNNSQTYKMDKLLSFFEEFNHSLKQFELMFYLVSYNNEKGVVLIFDNSPFFIIKNHVLFLTNEIFHKLTFEKCYYHLVD